MDRQASVLVSDELYITLLGKFVVHGVYTTDIVIPTEQTAAPQLIFLFQIGTDIGDLFEKLQVQVTLPGEPPRTMAIPVGPVTPTPERTRWLIHWPLLVQQAILRPGRIEVKVIHERGEILVSAPWITLATQGSPIQPS
jgi:hypothetical protein